MSVYRYSLPLLPLPALLLALLADPGWSLELPWLLTGGLLGMDELRRTFLLLTALLWTVAGVFATGYLKNRHLLRFWIFWVLTLTGNLGLTIALDVASFYSFFALMTFAGYGLVVHEGSDEANRAGRVYLAMAVVGEMAILTGLLMASDAANSTVLSGFPGAVADSGRRWLIMLLLLVGFGVKAGLPLLHFWLPLAHPVAPTPASAVLSGAMIKAGLLGWLVTLPFGVVSLPHWGDLLVILGAIGALGGGAMGVFQTRPKTVLAYSSISQMGLMTLMVAGALGSSEHSSAIFAVVALYVLHHGLAKGSLFLSTAMNLPSVRWQRGLMWLVIALPGFSLAGLPFTSGAMAKLAMKDVLKPSGLGFPLAEYLPVLMATGAIATLLLIWRFLWTFGANARTGGNSSGLWLGWSSATVSSLLLFWCLPMPSGLPGNTGFMAMQAQAWGLLWPLIVATMLAVVAWQLGRLRR
ncbi:MAG: complex I subunit 5 family protein [Marinobacter sp.]|nr:complex I subunit 5 family protein [Marinobacter sp.]